MRVILDTNLYISHLLSRQPNESAVGLIVAAAIARSFTLLFARDIAEEIIVTIASRSDLSMKIAPPMARKMIDDMESFAEVMRPLPTTLPEIGRDRKDDYLLAHAVVAGADYLVTRDKDLLDLVAIEGVRIVDPPEFLRLLRATAPVSEPDQRRHPDSPAT